MKISVCQYDIAWEDRKANKEKIAAMMDYSLRANPADWVIFPEMTLSGFTTNLRASTLDAGDFAFFSGLATKYSVNISFGAVTADRKNRLVTMNRKGEIIDDYAKIHLYAFGGEDREYVPGGEVHIFELEGLRVMPAVCFDLRFPYLFWNTAEKTDIYALIASWPAQRAHHWMTLLRARAIENQCYCVGVNRTGKDPFLPYSGNSMLYDPLGKVLLDSGEKEGIFTCGADIDKALVDKTRSRFPFIKERKNCPEFKH